MKRIALAVAVLALSACRAEPVHAQTPPKALRLYQVQVTSIYDGDTFSINLPGLPTELNPVKIRLRGVDTPERGGKAKCESERVRADAARAFTVKQIARTQGRVVIGNLDWDKYGGRIDADVYVGPAGNERLVDLLIQNGYGREYHGEARTKGWCF